MKTLAKIITPNRAPVIAVIVAFAGSIHYFGVLYGVIAAILILAVAVAVVRFAPFTDT